MTTTRQCKVWICGAQSTGKSTLARWVSRTYSLPILDEVASIEVAKLGGNLDRLRADLDAVTRFQRRVWAAQLEAGKRFRRYVSDRAFDNICYAAEHAESGTAARLWRNVQCRKYVKDIASVVAQKQGAVFFVRPGVDGVHNGVRAQGDLDAASVHRVDGAIKLLLELADVRYVPINTTIFQERASIVDGVLRHII